MNLNELLFEQEETVEHYIGRCYANGGAWDSKVTVFTSPEAKKDANTKGIKLITLDEYRRRVRELEYLEPEQEVKPVPVRIEPKPAESALIEITCEDLKGNTEWSEWQDSVSGEVKHRFG